MKSWLFKLSGFWGSGIRVFRLGAEGLQGSKLRFGKGGFGLPCFSSVCRHELFSTLQLSAEPTRTVLKGFRVWGVGVWGLGVVICLGT